MKWYFLAFKKYASFKGRATRKEFWLFVLFNFIVANVVGLVSGFLAAKTGHVEIGIAGVLVYYLATLIPTLAVTVRRLHDTSRSAWWLLISLAPLLGGFALATVVPKMNAELVGFISAPIGAIALLAILTLKGSKGDNRYGANPVVADRDATPIDHCPKCGEPRTSTDSFCGACGAPLEHLPVTTPQALPRKSRRVVMAVALLVFVVLGMAALFIVRQGFQKENQAGVAPFGPIVQVQPAVVFRGATDPSVDGSSGSASPADVAAAERDLARHPDDPKVINDLGCLLDASGATARGPALLSSEEARA